MICNVNDSKLFYSERTFHETLQLRGSRVYDMNLDARNTDDSVVDAIIQNNEHKGKLSLFQAALKEEISGENFSNHRSNAGSNARRRLSMESTENSENYYDDLPDFVTHDKNSTEQCKCVDCERDEQCGGLWKGSRYPGYDDIYSKKIHIVVSHCKSDLDWIPDFTKGFNLASIHVITKCGSPVRGAPKMATVQVYPNVGRCDHTYAYYITTILPQKMKEGEEDDSVVIFLKDDISAKNLHQSGDWNDFETMVRLASSENGFACGIIPDYTDFGQNRFFLSTYHEVKTLFEFSMSDYGRNIKGYETDGVEFKSEHENLGSWYESLGAGPLPEIVQVCYGGVFAASVSNVRKRNDAVWEEVERSLSRGNNIQEGHYAERSWANLLSTPLTSEQSEALISRSDGVYLNKNSMHGALLKRPKFFLHIGVEGTTSTEVLSESLIKDIDSLESDGYKIAVYGKWNGGDHGFPNIDRLGACMWSDMEKTLLPTHVKEGTICKDHVLSNLTEYMDSAIKQSHDLVMVNPLLAYPGTAESLGLYLNLAWDINVVIYYRRYFEWITIRFDKWHNDLMQHPGKVSTSSLRYIDFLRENCKRLFYGKDIEDDSFFIQESSRNRSSRKIGKVYFNQYDPTTNYQVEELTDLEDYTYFVAKQYHGHPRFRDGITIVNYHDIRGPEMNLYCHVLRDARNTCKAAVDRETKGSKSTNGDSFIQINKDAPFSMSHALDDIAFAAYSSSRLQLDGANNDERLSEQLLLWKDMLLNAIKKKKVHVSSFPKECLTQFEIDRLLEVSLAYEKALIPAFFASSKGGQHMEADFAKWNFCSVDTVAVLSDPKWNFLFEDASEYKIAPQPKVYVHIGAPKTGSTSIQDTMAMDKDILAQDKYFLAMHGQVTRKGKPSEFIVDNMLVECDRLGACIWSDEERQSVVEGSGNSNAGRCPDYLPAAFNDFLSKAIAAKSDVVISNEWLNRPSSETGLSSILEGWDPSIVIYYRRYFDWMISAHFQWHFDMGIASLEAIQGKVRLVDFIRMFCARLFASQSPHTPEDFDLTFVDLTDIQEYTYHAWKRYNSVPQYENKVKIVNFHDGHIIKSFYCDVLDAERACKMESERLEKGGSKTTRSKSSTLYVDLAIGLYWKDKKLFDRLDYHRGEKITMQAFSSVGERFKERMTAKGYSETDLPSECLTQSEQELLLNVSLAYEKILLPESFASGGEEATRAHFAKTSAEGKLCSVDLDGVLKDPKWSFLFNGDSSSATVPSIESE